MKATPEQAAALGACFSKEEVTTSIKLYMSDDKGAYERYRDVLVERHLKEAEEIYGREIPAEQFADSLDAACDQLAFVMVQMRIKRAIAEALEATGVDFEMIEHPSSAPAQTDLASYVPGPSTKQ